MEGLPGHAGMPVQPHKLPPDQKDAEDENQEIPMLPKGFVTPATTQIAGRELSKAPFCGRRVRWAVSMTLLGFLLVCICWVAPLAPVTWLALMRLFQQPGCPRNMRHALCNWGRFYRGTSGHDGSLAPSANNRLWVDPNTTVAHQSMADLVDMLQQGQPEDVHENLCHVIEEWLPRVGMNGLIDLLSGMEHAREHESAEVWGIDLDDFTPDLLDISGNWKHDLGAYVISRLDPHTVVNSRRYLGHAVEVAGSLKLGGAPLHAVTWSAMLAFLEASGWSNASGLWDFAMGRICLAFQDLPGLFVHCVHGFGHGAMLAGIALGLDEGQRSAYTARPACERVRNGTSGFELSPQMLDNALRICHSSPSRQLGYVCAGGAFMEFWKTFGSDWDPQYDGHALPSEPIAEVEVVEDWRTSARPIEATADRSPADVKSWMIEHSCAFANFSAACFRFEPGLGVSHQADKLQALADVPIFEPCTQSLWSSGVTWDLQHLRGCILGRSFALYPDYDLWRYGRLARRLGRVQSEERLPTLAEWCAMYEPMTGTTGRNQSYGTSTAWSSADFLKFPLLSGVRSYSNWLVCIAGGMAHVAFIVEGEAVKDAAVHDHCKQIDDSRGQQLCIETGLSRHLRNLSDLHIWPLELLEEEEIHPF